MKKLFILGAMLLTATFTLTNCTEEILGPVGPEEVPYTIFANAAETKTVNSGFSTLWAEGDSLSVFHAPAGTDKYSGNSRFDLVDAAEGKFVTTNLVGELAGSNDWYVFYPYSKYLVTPASTSKGYMVVASPYNKAQTQTGNNSMAHIAGENYPMWGVAENVSGEDLPGVTMTHLTSLVEVVVTNVTDAELTVSSVALTGTEPIVGTYFMDFTGETPLYTVSNDKYVSEVATLDVVNGESIPVSGNAKFYFAVKPFTAPAGQVLTLSVNGKEKVMTLVADVTFEPGKVKTLNYVYEGGAVNPGDKDFELDKKEVSVSGTGGEFDVTVFSTIGYKISSTPDWVEEISKTEDPSAYTTVHTFRVAANTGPEPRSGVIVFCNDNLVCMPVTVNQEGNTVQGDWINKNFYHRSVAMRFTADWCGHCPNMASGLDLAKSNMVDKLEVLSVHGGGGLVFSEASSWLNQYLIESFPMGIIDGRKLVLNYSSQNYLAQLTEEYALETENIYSTVSGVSMSSTVDGRNVNVKIDAYFKAADSYKLTALLVEDNVIAWQADYVSGDQNDYVHKGVVRMALSDVDGESITTSENEIKSFSYKASVPEKYDIDNMSVVVFVQRPFGSRQVIQDGAYGDYYIDNCASGKVGTDLVLRFAGDVPTPEKDDRFDPDFLRFLLNADNLKNNGTPDGKVDADGDGFLSGVELANITGLNLNGSGVVSLRGIELMRNLQYFKYENGGLQSLDLSKNVEVDYIYCRNNSISDVVLPSDKYLGLVDLGQNKLSSLDLTKNRDIYYLDCSGNQLTELDLSTNTGLEHLNCSDNMISELDISSLANFYSSGGVLYVGNQKNGATLTLSVSQQQESVWNQYWSSMTENANVTLSVFGQPSIKKPNVIIFSQPEEFYCDGVYDHTDGHGFSHDLGSKLDRSIFSLSFDYCIDPAAMYIDMPIFVLSEGYRVLEVRVSLSEGMEIIINGTSAYRVSTEVIKGEWQHVEIVYNNGDMLANDDYFITGDLNPNGDNILTSTHYGRGEAFNGKLANIVVKSGYEAMGPGGNIDDIPVEEW